MYYRLHTNKVADTTASRQVDPIIPLSGSQLTRDLIASMQHVSFFLACFLHHLFLSTPRVRLRHLCTYFKILPMIIYD